jgi:hypothetical protein
MELRGQFTSWHSYTSCESKLIFTEKYAEDFANIVRLGIAPFVEKTVRPFFTTDTTDDFPVTVFNKNFSSKASPVTTSGSIRPSVKLRCSTSISKR